LIFQKAPNVVHTHLTEVLGDPLDFHKREGPEVNPRVVIPLKAQRAEGYGEIDSMFNQKD